MAAISADRLLALVSGLRYKKIVTLKHTYFMVATIRMDRHLAMLLELR